jgi:hypothetical protein
MHTYFDKEALIERYPQWKKQIQHGDFKVYLNDKGCVTIEWSNTSIFRPSFQHLEDVICREYSETEIEHSQVHSSLMSLIVSTSVVHVQ